MLHYILQVSAFQLLFLMIYDLLLKRETFFQLNRAYLLVSTLLSVVIPFIKIPELKSAVAKDFVISIPEVIIGDISDTMTLIPEEMTHTGEVVLSQSISFWVIILYSGMVLAAILLLFKLLKMLWLVKKHPKHWKGKLLIIQLLNSNKAFSFFNYIFLGEKIKPAEKTTILKHELVHVRQLHTLDLLCFECLRIVFWFNPLVYMYQNRIATLHEYIADAKAVKHQNKSEYYNKLLSQVFETNQFSFVNPFFKQSLIKKRIVMLSKSKSKQINMMKYTLLVPLIFSMLIYTSSYAQKDTSNAQLVSSSLKQQNTDDEALKQQLYDELVTMEKEGKTFKEITDFVLKGREKYISSREDYYRFQMYTKLMADKMLELRSKQGTLTDEDIKTNEKFTSNTAKSYDQYLKWKKTDEAKTIWENNDVGGVLKLFVKDLSNMTNDEKKQQEAKLNQLYSDDYYHKLVVSDFYNRNEFNAPNSKTVKDGQSDSQTIIESSTVEVPFALIDQVPSLPECESLEDLAARKKCVTQQIAKHVNEKFNTKLAEDLGLVGRQRISVIFKINEQGHVEGVKARAPHPELENEAIRVISQLPKFTPGMHKGEPVKVPYSLPILFQVNSKTKNQESDQSEESLESALETSINKTTSNQEVEVPYHAVEEAPYLPECEAVNSRDERKKCVSQAVAKFVNKNFNLDMASGLGLIGVQRISTIFKIDTSGNVVDIKARAPHPDLEKEAIRVISELPTFIPGKDKGKVVSVVYALPIKFEVVGKRNRKKKN